MRAAKIPTFAFMKHLILALMLLPSLLLQAQQPEPKANPAKRKYVYQKKTSLVKHTYDSIYFDVQYEAGKNMVFKYMYRAQEQPMIADDEYFESLEFEIAPPKFNTFIIRSDDFEKHKVIFNRSCFCPDAGPRQLHSGTISGKRNPGGTWTISMNVMIEPRPGKDGLPTNKKLVGLFKPGKLTL